ncbi:hypothetical protein [Plesiomonas shigelloides]|uniref:hypothetical protein n=1 Tax=Plesiomonas shigelloides TaxID=703 RepID=UPI00387F2FE4
MSDVVRFYRSPQVLPAPAMDGNFDSVFAMFMVLVNGDGTQPGVGWELLHKDDTNRMFALKSPAGFIVRFWANTLYSTSWAWRIQLFKSLPSLDGNGAIPISTERFFEISSRNSTSYSPGGYLITASDNWFYLHLDYNRAGGYTGAIWFAGIPMYIDKFNSINSPVLWFNNRSKESCSDGIHSSSAIQSIFNGLGDFGESVNVIKSKRIVNEPVMTAGDVYADKIYCCTTSGDVMFYLPSIRSCFTFPFNKDNSKPKTNDLINIGGLLSCVVSQFYFNSNIEGRLSNIIFISEC